jgi:hypothetical protein
MTLVLIWEGKGAVTRKTGGPQNVPAAGARAMRTENLNRGAVVSGSMDDRDISDSVVGASLHTTRKTSSQ